MEVTTFELAEVLKEDRHKGSNIFCGLLCRALENEERYCLLAITTSGARTTVSP